MRNKAFKKVNRNKKIAKAQDYQNNPRGFLKYIYNPNKHIYHADKESWDKYKHLRNHHKSGFIK